MARRKNITLLCLIALVAMGCFSALRAEDSIWSALVLATNEEKPAAVPPELEKYEKKLKNIFGYNQFELIGEHVELMNSPAEHWLIPSRDFFLHVDSQKATKPGFFNVKLDLYEEQKVLAQMEAKLSGQNVLFIRGPFCGKGQLIIILLLK